MRSGAHGPVTSASKPHGRILVVEDEPLLRACASAGLRSLGYDVAEAETADRAMDLLHAGDSFDLLFTDLLLPGSIDGVDLARRACVLRPRLKVLGTSGYPAEEISAPFPLVPKPYLRDDLAAKVKSLLEAPELAEVADETVTTADEKPLEGKIVLLVEDDPVLLQGLADCFGTAGCRVMTAQDGNEALVRFAAVRPDLVVTDIIMPNKEGIETIMAIKAEAPEVPVLAISGGGKIGAGEFLCLARSLPRNARCAFGGAHFGGRLRVPLRRSRRTSHPADVYEPAG